MEICQHCDMYMKPMMVFKDREAQEGDKAVCEFCGEAIAVIEKREDGKLYWKKLDRVPFIH